MQYYFEVVNIKGKDLGCVALKDLKKGTLILKEKPQLAEVESNGIWTDKLFNEVWSNFILMSKSNRDDYLKLSNQFKEITFEKSKIENADDLKLLREIIGIYETNKFKGGVGIQAARFNHSCCSNVEGVWNKEEFAREFRVIKKISKGKMKITYFWEHNFLVVFRSQNIDLSGRPQIM